ncbi:MAG: membrane dipeptidase [Myxococcales bacterium]|nr:membrane dipeptidase [Myxococcales bacterium]
MSFHFRMSPYLPKYARALTVSVSMFLTGLLPTFAWAHPCKRISIGDSFLNKNTSARLGPRRLTFASLQGTLIGITHRRWNTYIPYDLDQAQLILQKRGGKGKVEVTVCKHRQESDPGTPILRFTIPSSQKKDRTTHIKSLRGVKHAFISVYLQGKSPLRKLAYRIRLKRPNQGKIHPPQRNKLGPVKGFADLHNHQVADLAHGGGYIFGHHARPLKACDGKSHGTLLWTDAGGMFRGKHPKQTQPYVWWPHYADGSHQQVGIKELKQAWRAGLRLLVATAVNNQALCTLTLIHKKKHLRCDDMDSARLQIQAIHEFARKNPWYRIARDPWEARKIIHQGHLAVIIAVEISNLFPRSHGDWREQLDELYDMGVRSFELAHETDSRFAGSAQQHGSFFTILNALKRFDNLRSIRDFFGLSQKLRKPEYCEKKGANYACNKLGLRQEQGVAIGAQLLLEAAKRKMLIPLDHISRRARKQVFEIIRSKLAYYPLFASHSRFDAIMHPQERKHGGTEEYMLSDKEVKMIQQTGGVFGLRTGINVMREIPGCLKKKLTCWGSSESLAQNVCWAARTGLAISLGTDLNTGPVQMTAPRFASNATETHRHDGLPTACPQNVTLGIVGPKGYDAAHKLYTPVSKGKKPWGFDVRGLAHIGYAGDLIQDMQKLGAPVRETAMDRSAETFLRMWERAYLPRSASPLSAQQYQRYMGTQSRHYPNPLPPVRYNKTYRKALKKALAQPQKAQQVWEKQRKKIQ